MSKKPFDKLAAILKDHLTGMDTNMRVYIPPEEKLIATLRLKEI
jgi:hypothetical protein